MGKWGILICVEMRSHLSCSPQKKRELEVYLQQSSASMASMKPHRPSHPDSLLLPVEYFSSSVISNYLEYILM